MSWLRLVALVAVLFVLSGCASDSIRGTPDPVPDAAPPAPSEVAANELGLIPVLMYHRIVPEPESVYGRTPEGFRAELERLAAENYVPITLADMVAGDIDIPAGTHPVVLTFDDGDPTTLTLGQDGEPAEGTAVDILLDVAAANPGFRPVASMYVNADPFGGGHAGQRALRWLHEHGFEIGNHTFGHLNLRTASRAQAQRAIARADEFITGAVPGAEPTTLALPFGARPHDPDVALHGPGYSYTGVLLVGANPAPSPFSAEFERAAIPRIRSQGYSGQGAEYASSVWLDKLAANPTVGYTSDGNASAISYPTGSGSPSDRFAAAAVQY